MTPDQVSSAKARVFVFFGIAIAAFVASYTVQGDFVQLGFVIVAVLCLLIAGRIAMKLKNAEAK